MVSINKFVVVVSLLVSGAVSSPVGANTPAFADIPEVSNAPEVSNGDARKAGKLPTKMLKPKKDEKSESPKSGLDKFMSDLTDAGNLAKNLQTQEGQDKFVNDIMKGVNSMIEEAAGSVTESLESAVDEGLSSQIGSILKGFGMGTPGGKGNGMFGGFDISKFYKP